MVQGSNTESRLLKGLEVYLPACLWSWRHLRLWFIVVKLTWKGPGWLVKLLYVIGLGNRKELSARSYPVHLGRMQSMRIKILHLNHVTLERLLNQIFIFRWLRIFLKSGSSEGLTSRRWNYMRRKCCWSLRFSVENLFFKRPTLQLRETDWIDWWWIVLFFKNDSSSNIYLLLATAVYSW